MLFPKNDSCRLSPFFIPTCLHIIAKIFGANLVSGFWVKQRAGRRFLRVRRRNGTGGKAVSEGWLALALPGAEQYFLLKHTRMLKSMPLRMLSPLFYEETEQTDFSYLFLG